MQAIREGGLGIKNLESFNLALLAKWRWRICNEKRRGSGHMFCGLDMGL